MNIQRPIKGPVKGSDRVRAFRARQKAKGLKPVTFWVPDLNDPTVQAQIRAECKAIADSPEEKEVLAWLGSLFEESVEEGFFDDGPPQK